ncbi:MAG: hypothetical protein MK161_17390 [Pirellulales bacterium]|nr:hypothetical protein [Pirellulales bacterium]
MKHFITGVLAFVAMAAICRFTVDARADAVAPKADQTTPQEPHWQLFLDNHVLERSMGFRRMLHHPQPRGIVLPADKPWETHGVSPMYVGWRKDGRMECYYRVHWWKRGLAQGSGMAYAISHDGLVWEKPVLNQVEGPTGVHRTSTFPYRTSVDSGKNNNLILCSQLMDLGRYGNVSDPAKRFAINFEGPDPWGSYHLYFGSEPPDPLLDPNWREKFTSSGGWKPGPYNTLDYWDDLNQEWVGMRQSPNHPPARAVARYASHNLRDWKMQPVLYPDAEDSSDPRFFDEIYGIRAIHTEGLVLGYAYWFIGDQTHAKTRINKGPAGQLVMKGPLDVRIVVSRDGGLSWDRTVSREAWIPHGSEEDSYDRQVRLDAPPIRGGDEDWFYGAAVDGDHASSSPYYGDRMPQIQGVLYTQKHNRYVSLTAGNAPQILITKPIKVTGRTLQLNVDASHGEVRVGIGVDKIFRQGSWPFVATLPNFMPMARDGKAHFEKGFHFENCEPIHNNSIEQSVTFEKDGLESLQGQTVRLFFKVQDADLYGFRFK